MGIGNSRQRLNPRQSGLRPLSRSNRRPPSPLGGNQPRRHLFARTPISSVPEPALPLAYRSPYHNPHGSYPYASGMPFYPPLSPMLYNDYASSPYGPLGLNMMLSPQQFGPMMMLQQTPQFTPVFSPQAAVDPRFMMMPQALPAGQQVFSRTTYPISTPPYSGGLPLTTPYVQPQAQTNSNNMGGFMPISSGAAGTYRLGTRNVTDWTGGGSISPGFLGPPI